MYVCLENGGSSGWTPSVFFLPERILFGSRTSFFFPTFEPPLGVCVAEYHFKQQLLIQVARHVNCNKKQQLKKLEGKVRGLIVHRTQQTGRRIIAGRPRARIARIYFNRKEDTGPQTPCSCRASLQKSSQSCFHLRSKVLSFSEEKEKQRFLLSKP
jgi:hypothetical protein